MLYAEELSTRMREITDGRGVDVVYDLGSLTGGGLWNVLTLRGE